MTAEELLQDLAKAMGEPEAAADLAGVLASWGQLARGEVDPDTERWRVVAVTVDPREALALTLAEAGPVTSAQLAVASHYSQEAARLTLAGMCARGELVRVGDHRSARYILPPRVAV
jgi:hypothetical protein